ncbi:MAG: hypothetical protein SGJ21_09610 [Alphaproteobacteria bacterium]|nr:hypothetical protein [Alphaproteobacteria bacterium]
MSRTGFAIMAAVTVALLAGSCGEASPLLTDAPVRAESEAAEDQSQATGAREGR